MEELEISTPEGEGRSRFRSRWVWLLSLVFTAGAAIWIGKSWLFAEAECPRLQEVILYTVTGGMTPIFLLWALLTRNDSPLVKMGSVLGLPIVILVLAQVAGAFLTPRPASQSLYCPAQFCREAELARSLREEGKWEAAGEAARRCLAGKPSTQREAECQRECAYELALALYEKGDPNRLPAWDRGRESACQQVIPLLEEAYNLASLSNYPDLARSVSERQQRLIAACATPTPGPTPAPILGVEVLRTRYSEREVFADIRVLENGQFLSGLQASDFRLFSPAGPLPFQLEARAADDPICLIAVVDNSGSVRPGLEQLREAIRALNEARKPGDELGLVVFGSHDQIFTRSPSPSALDTGAVDASGQRTALWDGALAGLELSQHCSFPYRYLLLLTDGADNDSRKVQGDDRTQAREVVRRAAEVGVYICTIGIRSQDLKPEPLQIAAQGCGYYPAEDFDKVASLFKEIFGYLRDFYRLRLEPTTVSPGSVLTLQVLNRAEVSIEFHNP